MNKLRIFAGASAVTLLGLTGWSMIQYNTSNINFLLISGIIGILIGILPAGIMYGKYWLRQRWRCLRQHLRSSRSSVFVSEPTAGSRNKELVAIAEVIQVAGDYETVTTEDFPEGEGLSVAHGGFHNSFIRITKAGQIVVTGASEKTSTLAHQISNHRKIKLTNVPNNPFSKPEPVKGAPRGFLGIFLAILLIIGITCAVSAAYPSPAYNPSERAVLVSYDMRADVDPGFTKTDAQLSKAAFLTKIVEEEAVEVRWEESSSQQIAGHGRQALIISKETHDLLQQARSSGLTTEQRATAQQIETDLESARRAVSIAITERIEEDDLNNQTGELIAVRNDLNTTNQS